MHKAQVTKVHDVCMQQNRQLYAFGFLDLAHKILQELSKTRRAGKELKYLRPDAKSQVTIEYNDNNEPIRIDTIVVSTQHDDFAKDKVMLDKIQRILSKSSFQE